MISIKISTETLQHWEPVASRLSLYALEKSVVLHQRFISNRWNRLLSKASCNLIPTDNKRPIRSYVIRSGRLTDSQRKALENHWMDHVIEYEAELIDINTVFPEIRKLTIEIGFGMGDSLLTMAVENPNSNYIGIEVHKPGVGKLLQGITERKLNNLKIICHDAKEVLLNCFEARTIDKLQIYFPDPWPKKRHNKRRIVQPDFIELLEGRLKQNGLIHLATDWQAYAEHMLEVMESAEGLQNYCGDSNYWLQPDRPGTKFERRGQLLGHGVWDLLFEKR